MSDSDLPISGNDAARRAAIRDSDGVHGIDYVRVVEAQRVLEVHFLGEVSPQGTLDDLLTAFVNDSDAVSIDGGVRITNVEVQSVKRVADHLEVRVNHPGDFSPYVLRLETPPGGNSEVDPAFSRCEFSFKVDCPSRFDCKPRPEEPPEEPEAPDIDYMAKDYASFRRALLDYASRVMPDWEEHREADLRTMLVELLAHAGDELSYFQDAVANEAYLETARQRTSVRRHARLLDYQMHDGLSARSFLHVAVKGSSLQVLPAGTQVLSTITQQIRNQSPPHDPVFDAHVRAEAEQAADVVFETFTYLPSHEALLPEEGGGIPLHGSLNQIELHAWETENGGLPAGSTSADLRGDYAFDESTHDFKKKGWRLKKGDLLLLEEVRDPETGRPAGADPDHRQVVRLTEVESNLKDPLTGDTVTRVHWHPEDALDFSLCVRSEIEGTEKTVGVARGNLVPVDHGRTVTEHHSRQSEDRLTPRRRATANRPFRFKLEDGPLSYRLPMGAETPVRRLRDVSDEQARESQSQAEVWTGSLTPDQEFKEEDPPHWVPVHSFLAGSDAFDRHFVPEPNNDGRPVIRFGNDEFGRSPPEDVDFRVEYRVGVGRAGHVGADSLTHVVRQEGVPNWPDIKEVRNPVPAWGGVDPEAMETVKEVAPEAFHAKQFRAVTEEDYSDAAEEHPEVSKAVATFRWTGSWHTVFIAIDPTEQVEFGPDLEQSVLDWVNRFAMAGYDLEISEPVYVPLEIGLEVCAAPNHFRAHVEEALLEALSSRRLEGGDRGFFHPDRFTFGQPLYESQLYAAIEEVPGVESAQLTRFKRLHREPAGELKQGYVPAGRKEVLRLDNDPNFPENGILELEMQGGK
jgi:hypothetical protein